VPQDNRKVPTWFVFSTGIRVPRNDTRACIGRLQLLRVDSGEDYDCLHTACALRVLLVRLWLTQADGVRQCVSRVSQLVQSLFRHHQEFVRYRVRTVRETMLFGQLTPARINS
jgi:hypothetical protein